MLYPPGRRGWGGENLTLTIVHGDYELSKKLIEAGADANKTIDTNIIREPKELDDFKYSTTAFGHTISRVRNDEVKFVSLVLNSRRPTVCYPDTIVSRTNRYLGLVLLAAFLAAIGFGRLAIIKTMLRHGAKKTTPPRSE